MQPSMHLRPLPTCSCTAIQPLNAQLPPLSWVPPIKSSRPHLGLLQAAALVAVELVVRIQRFC